MKPPRRPERDAPPPTRRDIDAEAAEWIGRRDAGPTTAEAEAFARWIQDPRNAEAHARLDATWRSLDRLSAFKPAAGIQADPDLALRPRRRRPAWLGPILLAAAAAVAGLFALRRTAAPAGAEPTQIAHTAVGEQRKLELADGSVVELNTDSAVTVAYTHEERRVSLDQGEAHFAVAKNPARPFIVAVGGVRVRAVGTAFDVRLRADSVEVLVTEGKVRVDDAARGDSLLPPSASAAPALLVAGQRVLIAIGPGAAAGAAAVSAPLPAEITRELAWQQGWLQFGPAPLSEVVAEFNRYNRHQLVIADPQIGALRIGGNFRPENYDNFVHVLETVYGVQATRGPEATWLSKAK